MRRSFQAILALALVVAHQQTARSQQAELDGPTKAALNQLFPQLGAAQRQQNETEVRRLAAEMRKTLGEQAGMPEIADELRPVPAAVPKLTVEEARRGFEPYLKLIQQGRWWQIGLDPTKTEHAPREAASVIAGCAAAHRAQLAGSQAALAIARQAGDYLIWTQEQGGRGLVPFPAVRNGHGRAFEAAERFLRRAEHAGKLDQVLRNGWQVDDLGDGGLQFDNGLCGVALLELFEATKDDRYRRAAMKSADWALGQAVVPNWNYNSFSVYLLAKAYGATKQSSYLESAKNKSRLGIYPGQLLDGPRQGRWADPHNARPAYHYIMVRGVAAMLDVMPPDDRERADAIRSLSLALKARNPDFAAKGMSTVDSAVEALLMVKSLPKRIFDQLGDCQVDAALAVLAQVTQLRRSVRWWQRT